MSLHTAFARYSFALRKPAGVPPAAALIRVMSAAHSGATALVPPTTVDVPPMIPWSPVSGEASPATSGTPRLVSAAFPPEVRVALSPFCQTGTANTALTPPPPAPPWSPSFHTTSSATPFAFAVRLVPPHASTYGLDAGKSTWFLPSWAPSLEPLSPDATHTVTPIAAADCNTSLNALCDCAVHVDSGPPQLIEITDGLLVSSWAAPLPA